MGKIYRLLGILVALFCTIQPVKTPFGSVGTVLAESPSFGAAARKLFDGAKETKTVAFVSVTDWQGNDSELAATMFGRLEGPLYEAGAAHGVQFLERRELQFIMDEWALASLGEEGGDGGAETLLGADHIITAKVRKENDRIHCSLKLVRLVDGVIVNIAEGWEKTEPVKAEAVAVVTAVPEVEEVSNVAQSKDGRITLWTDKQSYRVGDEIIISFRVQEPLYVQIIDVTPDGAITTIFPNPYQSDNYCVPGVEYRIPPLEAPFRLEVTPPAGVDRIKAVASESPMENVGMGLRGIQFTQQLVTKSPVRTTIAVTIEP